jgi:hypothetical protein
MNSIIFNKTTEKILSGIFIIIILTAFYSCSTNVKFLNSSVVPAARGTVKVKVDKNKNYAIDLSLSYLAEVSRLEPAKSAYIVWMVTDKDITKNIGQINSSKSLMSKRLKGSFKTVSSDKPTKIYITAENDPNIQYPGNMVVLTTDTFRP